MRRIKSLKYTVLALCIGVAIAGCNGTSNRSDDSVDTTSPVITLNGEAREAWQYGAIYEDHSGAIVTDNTDGNISIDVTHDVDEFQIGTYTVTYNATDASGNKAETVTREVEVVIGFDLPSTYYKYQGYRVWEEETFHRISKWTVNEDQSLWRYGPYQNGIVDYDDLTTVFEFIQLEEGDFVTKTDASPVAVEYTPFSRLIEDGTLEIRVLERESLSNGLVSEFVSDYTDGDPSLVDSNAIMPVGSEVLTLGVKRIAEIYELDHVFYTPVRGGDIDFEEEAHESFEELLASKCLDPYVGFDIVNDHKTIVGFPCGQEFQTSGTLEGSEPSVDGSIHVIEEIGTWELVTLPESDIKAIITTIAPDYRNPDELDQRMIFVERDGLVWQGTKYDVRDEERRNIVFNEVALNAILDSIVE